jgi:hypothetical protein
MTEQDELNECILLFIDITNKERETYVFDERRNKMQGILFGEDYIEKIGF